MLPLVMLTSLGQRENGSNNIDFAAYLTKPIKPSKLYNILTGIFVEQPAPVKKSVPQPQFDRQMGQDHPLRILLAEDNIINQKVTLGILERVGYRADIAANGLEVLESLKRQPYDVVLMDVQMPEMDGVEATRIIRQKWPKDQQPHIVALTANALQGDREEFLNAGMDDYVSKPIEVDELIRALTQCQPAKNQTKEAPVPLTKSPQTPAVKPSNSTAIDSSVLENFETKMGADGPEMVGQLITLFLEDTPKLLVELQQQVIKDDADGMRRTAHTLKSNSATFGALKLSALCADLEQQGKAGSIYGAESMITQIKQEFNHAQAELMRYAGVEQISHGL
jgi:CheY-like chemotaxis protein/HPt (histidine-containing phosphotransfer) domain-containing protein